MSVSAYQLCVAFGLPDNPDLLLPARAIEAEALNMRTMVLQTCTNPETRAECENTAEIAFREKISSIPGASFILGYIRPSGETRRLFALTSEQAVDPKLNQAFGHLQPNAWSPLGVSVSVAADDAVLVGQIPGDFAALAFATGVVIRVNEGDDPNEGLAALWRYADPSTQRAAEALLELGASATEKDKDGFTPLLRLCDASVPNAPLASALLEHGASVDERDPHNRTPLIELTRRVGNPQSAAYVWLSDEGTQRVVALATVLLEHGADPNAIGEYGETPLGTLLEKSWMITSPDAAPQVALTLAELLINKGADVNGRSGGWGITPLMAVALSWRSDPSVEPEVEFMKLLLRHGADIALTTDWGKANGVPTMTSQDITVRGNAGGPTATAADIAAQSGLKQCVALLQAQPGNASTA